MTGRFGDLLKRIRWFCLPLIAAWKGKIRWSRSCVKKIPQSHCLSSPLAVLIGFWMIPNIEVGVLKVLLKSCLILIPIEVQGESSFRNILKQTLGLSSLYRWQCGITTLLQRTDKVAGVAAKVVGSRWTATLCRNDASDEVVYFYSRLGKKNLRKKPDSLPALAFSDFKNVG